MTAEARIIQDPPITVEDFDELQEGVAIMDSETCRFQWTNPFFRSLFGIYGDIDHNATYCQAVPVICSNGLNCPVRHVLGSGRHYFLEVPFEGRIIELSASPVTRKEGRARIILIARDISSRKNAEEQLRHLAFHDPLTGAGNRHLLDEQLPAILEKCQSEKMLAGIFFIDLDRFKEVNDTLGHAVGDRLLKIVVQRLRSCVRDDDLVVRLGGDEFILVVLAKQEKEFRKLARRVQVALLRPFSVDAHQVTVTLSIGGAIFPTHGSTGEELIRAADAAMYAAKGKNWNRIYFES